MQCVVALGRDLVAPSLLHPEKSDLFHETLDGAASDRVSLATQLLQDLLRDVDAVVTGVVDALDLEP